MLLLAARRSAPHLRPTAAAMSTAPAPKKAPMVPKPSSSIMVLSPTNQLLLLHRVQTSTSFPSAHVFPGGNLSKYHEAGIPEPESLERHRDGPAYRLGAIRETFEEAGILLAKPKGGSGDKLIELPEAQVEDARKLIHGNKKRFTDWVDEIGGVCDTDGLIPFTRWVTPPNVPKRFTTQMYVYMLPLSASISRDAQTVVHTPSHDGGLEHTAAAFDDVADWLQRQARGEIILFPPQLYLLSLLGQFLTGPGDYQAQRDALRKFLESTPTGPGGHPTARIPWAEKVISPVGLGITRADGRNVLSLEGPGKEVRDQDPTRAGDHSRVVLVKPTKRGPSEVEIIWRSDLGAAAESAKVDYEVVVSKHPSRDAPKAAAKL